MAIENRPPVLITAARIQGRVAELAAAVSRDFAEADGLLLVGVLRGAFIFLADLARQITVPHTVDFVALSHYEAGRTATGKIALRLDLRSPVAGRPVLIVEDIVDTGWTLSFLREHLLARRPAALKTCVLVRKPARRQVEVPLEYVGFDIPDLWAVGYGLDCADRWRSLPYIGTVAGDESQGA
jgi:hypoxanthine phosphoribosyltransferase